MEQVFCFILLTSLFSAPVLLSFQSLNICMTKAAEKYSRWRIIIFYSVSMSMIQLEEEKKRRYWSFLTCCAPSPLTIGEVRRGISLLIIEVVSSNGGCSAIIDGTLIHKITCKEKLFKWLNYTNIYTLKTASLKKNYEIRYHQKVCSHNIPAIK